MANMLLIVVSAAVCDGYVMPSRPSVDGFHMVWRAPLRRHRWREQQQLLRCVLPAPEVGEDEQLRVVLGQVLLDAGISTEPIAVTEMSAGFCNWVYCVALPPPAGKVVAKLFSPLAKLRLEPALRGLGDQTAGEAGLGPSLLCRSADGLVTTFVDGETLTEEAMHAADSKMAERIAPRLAALHATPMPESDCSQVPVLWRFLDAMLQHTEDKAIPASVPLEKVRTEVKRMRKRCADLALPTVYGHGDLKPSNVMLRTGPLHPLDEQQGTGGENDEICFIDFELSGLHYRGYDLYKLFRTKRDFSDRNFRAFLEGYCAALAKDGSSSRPPAVSLTELEAEAYAAEPLTWLEAAVFFFFALSVYPTASKAGVWAELGMSRWESYLETAGAIDADGEATRALLAARAC